MIEHDDTGGAYLPAIAVDTGGNAIAVWEQSDGMRDNIWANRFDAATKTWGIAEVIESGDGDARQARIAIDGEGNAIAVWAQDEESRKNIRSNRYDVVGKAWGLAQTIETEDYGSAYLAGLAMNEDGHAVAVWRILDNTESYNVWANRYDVGGGAWKGAMPVTEDGLVGNPHIAVTGGIWIAVWSQGKGSEQDIWANSFDSIRNGWSTAEPIEIVEFDALHPTISMDSAGNAIAVWEQGLGTVDIWANRYDVDEGVWGSAERIETNDEGDASWPAVVMTGSGEAFSIWQQNNGTYEDIWANRFDPQNRWGTAEPVETANKGDANEPRIAVDPFGNAVAVWEQSDGTRDNIWSNRFDSTDEQWSTAQLLENNDGGAGDQQVVVDDAGNAIAIWSQSDGDRHNIWVSRLEP